MKYPMNAISRVVEDLLRFGAWKTTKYLTDKQIVRASRKLYDGKIRNHGNIEIILTLGKPNSREREFIKQCKKAGQSFPVKKIQFKFPPKKK